MARRKRYSAEFKRQALKRANEPGVTDPWCVKNRASARVSFVAGGIWSMSMVKSKPFLVMARAGMRK